MSELFSEAALTVDALLDGRVRLWQPRTGYRAATDPVLLAAAADVKAGQRVLDIGCGVGAVLACLRARIEGAALHGLELEPAYADLARRNVSGATLWEGDLFAPPAGLKEEIFDWVLTNPPFFDAADTASPDRIRDAARREGVGAARWVAASLRRVRSGGRIAIIHLAERVPDILAGLSGAGDIAVLPLVSRSGRDARRVIVTARKGARGPFRLVSPFVLHAGDRHVTDADDFTPEATAILRDAASLRF